ncbi:MAG: DUF4386 domain-containing protein [Candidatus Korobacteraceae bacterium]
MSAAVMMERIAEASPRFRARMAGVFYLLNGGTAFAFFVRGQLVVSGDAAATATNILAHEPLFRMALAADLIGVASYVVVTALLYDLFKPVNSTLSLLAAFFSLVGCAVQVVACVFHLASLVVLGGAQYLSVFKTEQLQAMALMFLKLHGQGFDVAIVFFGLYCLLIGYLIFKSTFLPRTIGVLMALGGLGYVTNNLANFLALPVPMLVSHLVPAIGGLGEGSLILWLLFFGVNPQRWKEQAGAAGELR